MLVKSPLGFVSVLCVSVSRKSQAVSVRFGAELNGCGGTLAEEPGGTCRYIGRPNRVYSSNRQTCRAKTGEDRSVYPARLEGSLFKYTAIWGSKSFGF